MVTSLWFFVALGFLLARAEGAPPWRSAVATFSGTLLGAYGLIDTSQQSASLHGTSVKRRPCLLTGGSGGRTDHHERG